MAIKKKVKKITKPLKRKTAKKPPLKKGKKTFEGAENRKVRLKNGRVVGRVHTQKYKAKGNEYVPVGPAFVENATYNKDGSITENQVSTIKSRGATTKATITADPTITANAKTRAANKKKKAAENKTPISRRKTVAKKKKKTTVKKKKK